MSKKNKKPQKEIIYPRPKDLMEKIIVPKSEINEFSENDSTEVI
jgi:hypothetical protein